MIKDSLRTMALGAVLASLLVAPAAVFAEPNVNVTVSGYLPAPPGVHVYLEGERPYYIERDRRVYIERDHRSHRHKHGHAYGHHKHEGGGGRNGHGKHKGRG